jgi:hypothetical protein
MHIHTPNISLVAVIPISSLQKSSASPGNFTAWQPHKTHSVISLPVYISAIKINYTYWLLNTKKWDINSQKLAEIL